MLEVVLRSLSFTALAACTFIPLEHAFGEKRAAHSWRRSDWLYATLGQVVVALGLAYCVGIVLALLGRFALDDSPLAWIASPGLRSCTEVVLGLLLFELVGYGYHRLAHRVGFLWRLHAVHHVQRPLDWLASFRQHPVEVLLMTCAQNVPLVLLAVPLQEHALILLLLKLNTVFVHANLRLSLGPLRHLLCSPQFHHHHHAPTGQRSNFASLLVVLDRVFGTYQSPG